MAVALLRTTGRYDIVTIGDRIEFEFPLPAWFERSLANHVHIALDADTPSQRNVLGVALDRAVAKSDRAVVLMAQGAACLAPAWWARLSPASYVARVAGALLFDPQQGTASDVDRFASPQVRLPFPSLVLGEPASGQAVARRTALAQQWGSRLLATGVGDTLTDLRAAGSVSPWLQVQHIVRRWSSAVVDHDTRVAEALAGRGLTIDR